MAERYGDRDDRDTDRYGRALRVLERDGRSLGQVLVGEGLAHRRVGPCATGAECGCAKLGREAIKRCESA